MKIKCSEYIKNCLKIDIEDKVLKLIDKDATIVTFGKGCRIINVDEEVNSFYFIIYGLVRGFYINEEGEEATKCFSSENNFFGSECFRTKGKSTFFIESIEECKCVKLPYSLINEVMNIDKMLSTYINNLYLREVGKLENRAKDLLLLSAEERYISFCREYPNLQKRLPLKYIASYNAEGTITPKDAMSAKEVANIAVKRLMKNKEVTITGMKNKLLQLLPVKIKMIGVANMKSNK